MIRTLIVDDEDLARERLRLLLKAFEDVEVVAEADSGEDALEKIAALQPDLVFLDIQMPGCSGLEVAANLPAPRPGIVFCTAFDQFAIDAFELHAVDYLLKPVTRARLALSMQRIRSESAGGSDAAVDGMLQMSGGGIRRFLVKRANRFSVIPENEVLCFTAEEGETRLQRKDQTFIMDPSLSDLEKRLDPARFFRISRQAIINLDAVREVIPLIGGFGQVQLANGSRLEVSRRRMKELMERLA